jgi:hypothetical protein
MATETRPLLPGVPDEAVVGAGWFLGWLALTIVVVVLNENVKLARPIIWGSLGLIDASLLVSNATTVRALVDKFIADMGAAPRPNPAAGGGGGRPSLVL